MMKKPKKRRAGRPTLCTRELTKKLCAVLEQANTIKTACALTGISEKNYFNWRAQGETGERDYVYFFQSTTRARARAKERLVNIIMRAAENDARHAEWLLERSWCNEYGRAERLPEESEEEPQLGMHITFETHDSVTGERREVTQEELQALPMMQFPERRLVEKNGPKADDDGADDVDVPTESFWAMQARERAQQHEKKQRENGEA